MMDDGFSKYMEQFWTNCEKKFSNSSFMLKYVASDITDTVHTTLAALWAFSDMWSYVKLSLLRFIPLHTKKFKDYNYRDR